MQGAYLELEVDNGGHEGGDEEEEASKAYK